MLACDCLVCPNEAQSILFNMETPYSCPRCQVQTPIGFCPRKPLLVICRCCIDFVPEQSMREIPDCKCTVCDACLSDYEHIKKRDGKASCPLASQAQPTSASPSV